MAGALASGFVTVRVSKPKTGLLLRPGKDANLRLYVCAERAIWRDRQDANLHLASSNQDATEKLNAFERRATRKNKWPRSVNGFTALIDLSVRNAALILFTAAFATAIHPPD